MIEYDTGEYAMVSSDNPFTIHSKPKVFDTREEAEEAAKQWNTGRVIEFIDYEHIRPMTQEERLRAYDRG